MLPGRPGLSTGDSEAGRHPCLLSRSFRAEPQPGPALDSVAPQGWGTGAIRALSLGLSEFSQQAAYRCQEGSGSLAWKG